MDMDDDPHHSQSRKRWRIDCSGIGTGSNDAKLVPKKMEQHQLHVYHDEDEDGDGDGSNDKDRLLAWHSSRIFRVSRASGGKDRHSKVLTAKGLRDRRVRLSVSTAIQFYDLQDRLGYDQPSKAVEWLIKKAADAIAELPSLNSTAFPPTPKQASDEKRPEPEPTETDQVHPFTFHNHQQQQQQQLIHLSGSACSSTSETSKGSVLSLSRSEIRVKARERARERAAKERDKDKEKENDSHLFDNQHHHDSPTPNPGSNPQTSFTDLLTGNTASLDTATARHHPNTDLFPKHFREMAAAMDYFGRQHQHQHQHQHQQAMVSPGVSRPQHYPLLLSSFGSPPSLNVLPLNISATTSSSAGDHAELQHFSFIQDHLVPVAQALPNDYNLNFSISSSQQAGFNRGTLQSNTPSSMSHHHPHKFPSPVDGPPSVPFFISPDAAENNQFPAGFDGRLQLYYGDPCRHSDPKGKSKN